MSVPCPSFKPEMMFFVEVIKKVSVQYNSNKSSTNNYVKSVKPCGDKKCAPVSTIRHSKSRKNIFSSLNNSKIKTQHNSHIYSNSTLYSILFNYSHMCSCDRAPSRQKNYSIKERDF